MREGAEREGWGGELPWDRLREGCSEEVSKEENLEQGEEQVTTHLGKHFRQRQQQLEGQSVWEGEQQEGKKNSKMAAGGVWAHQGRA